MNIKRLLTQRNWCHTPSMQIVYEWEDEISKACGWKLKKDRNFYYRRYYRWIKPFVKPWESSKPAFQFVISLQNHKGRNRRNIVPLIIDFFCRGKEELETFYNAFGNHELVLISSKEAYEYLLEQGCPLNIRHCALSLPDRYAINRNTYFEKKFDIMLFGRYNQVLRDFAFQYKEEHPDMSIVIEDPKEKYRYITSDGTFVGYARSRQEYWDLMRATRVGLYATPSIDSTGSAKKRTQGYNQVTPKFLEYIACGCHVIARYPKNADTDYYELEKFCPSIENYEQFSTAMTRARTAQPDMEFYANYLSRHYTSRRAAEIQSLINEYE